MRRLADAIRSFIQAQGSMWLSTLVALGALVIMAGLAEDRYASARTRGIDIDISKQADFHFVKQTEVKQQVQRYLPAMPRQYPFSELPLSDFEEMLEQRAHVASAEVFTGISGHLAVRIRQRKPLVRIINAEQESFYLDEAGERMAFSPDYDAPLLTASGAIQADPTDSLSRQAAQQLQAIQQVSRYIRQDSFLRALTGQLYVASNQDIQLVPRIGEQTIVLGRAENLADRFAKLKAFYRKVLPSEGWYTYDQINLKYEKQIVAKK